MDEPPKNHLRPVRDDHHEVEHDGPAPVLDADVEAQVQSLLRSAPDPGPMPEHVADRIRAALADEARLRVEPGPLARRSSDHPSDQLSAMTPTRHPGRSGTGLSDHDDAVLVPLIRQRQRPRPLFAAAAVAAAAAVVAVGGSALHLNKRTDGTAAIGNDSIRVTSPTPPPITPSSTPPSGGISSPANSNLHIQLSRTRYTEGNLATEARNMLTRPDAPIPVLAAEAPMLGPIATEIGLTSCLRELGLPTDVPVFVDLARYEGQPVAVIAVTEGSTTTVRVVQRSCTTGHADVVAPEVTLP